VFISKLVDLTRSILKAIFFRTLEDKDIAPIIEEIAAMAAEEFDAAQV